MALLLHERATEAGSEDLVRMTLLEGGADPALVNALIPSRQLEPGEQYRFHFDMTRCIGCRSCEVACNEQNRNPAEIQWRRVGELEGGVYPLTKRTYLSMGCNHCLSADCLRGCPVDAYTKDPITESGFTSSMPGYRKFENGKDHAELAAIWGIDAERLPKSRGLAYPDIIEAAVRRQVKALWFIATNPVVSFPNYDLLTQALRTAEFVVVQDGFFPTPTTEFADLVLPGAIWGEKEGTYTNSERRVTKVNAFARPCRALCWHCYTGFSSCIRSTQCWRWACCWALRVLASVSRCPWAQVGFPGSTRDSPWESPAPATAERRLRRYSLHGSPCTSDGRTSMASRHC